MTERRSVWARFRRLPTWSQLLVWFFLWPVPTGLYAASQSPGARRRWWALTAVVALAWVGIAAASGQVREPRRGEQAGKQDTTTSTAPAPSATTSTAVPEITASTAVTTTKSPPTTVPPASPSGDVSTLLAQLGVT